MQHILGLANHILPYSLYPKEGCCCFYSHVGSGIREQFGLRLLSWRGAAGSAAGWGGFRRGRSGWWNDVFALGATPVYIRQYKDNYVFRLYFQDFIRSNGWGFICRLRDDRTMSLLLALPLFNTLSNKIDLWCHLTLRTLFKTMDEVIWVYGASFISTHYKCRLLLIKLFFL